MKLKDLKRGMKCICRNGLTFIVWSVDVEEGRIEYLGTGSDGCDYMKPVNSNLTNPCLKSCDIVEVLDISLNGWNSIWKRSEQKYYLRVKDKLKLHGYRPHLQYLQNKNAYVIDELMPLSEVKSKFTQDEINNLSQELVALCDLIPVESEY